MKNPLLLLLLFVCYAQAQNIVFPDPVFKAKLLTTNQFVSPVGYDQNNNYIVIDANNDGEISETEALAVYDMNLDAGDISDITGISYFQNLNRLWIVDNPITSININSLHNLKDFTCNSSQALTNLVLNDEIEQLELSGNLLTSLNVTSCLNLKKLNCESILLLRSTFRIICS